MEEDFINRYGGSDEKLREKFRHLYREVIADLLESVQSEDQDQEGYLLRSIAVDGVRLAREFTYDMAPHLTRTRVSKRQRELMQSIEALQAYQAKRRAQLDQEREAALRSQRGRRAKKPGAS